MASLLVAARLAKTTAPICQNAVCQQQLSPIPVKVKLGQKVSVFKKKPFHLELVQNVSAISNASAVRDILCSISCMCCKQKNLHANHWSQLSHSLAFAFIQHVPLLPNNKTLKQPCQAQLQAKISSAGRLKDSFLL